MPQIPEWAQPLNNKPSNLPEWAQPLSREDDESETGLVEETVTGFARGMFDVVQAPVELIDFGANMVGADKFRESVTKPVLSGIDKVKESAILKPSEEAVEDKYSPSWFASNVSQAAPTLLSMFIPVAGATKLATAKKGFDALSVADKAAKVSKAQKIAAGASGIGLEGAFAHGGLRQHAEQNPDDPDVTRLNDFVTTVGTGVFAGGLEALSGMKFFGRMFGDAGGKVAGELWKRIAKEVPQGIAVEGGPEAVQEVIGNFFKQLGYKPDQDLVEGAFDAFLVGGLLGGGVGGMAATVQSPTKAEEKPQPTEEKPSNVPEWAAPIKADTSVSQIYKDQPRAQVTPEPAISDQEAQEFIANSEYDKYSPTTPPASPEQIKQKNLAAYEARKQ